MIQETTLRHASLSVTFYEDSIWRCRSNTWYIHTETTPNSQEQYLVYTYRNNTTLTGVYVGIWIEQEICVSNSQTSYKKTRGIMSKVRRSSNIISCKEKCAGHTHTQTHNMGSFNQENKINISWCIDVNVMGDVFNWSDEWQGKIC